MIQKIEQAKSIDQTLKQWFGLGDQVHKEPAKLEEVLAILIHLDKKHKERVDQLIKLRQQKL